MGNRFYVRLLWSGLARTLLCCWLLSAPPIAAQTLPPTSHQAWSTDEGAPLSGVHQIFQSADGFLWLATENGAVRFDGSNFALFGHESEVATSAVDVIAMAQDSTGVLWAATSTSLAEFRGGTWRNLNTAQDFPGSVLAIAAADDGSLLAATGTQLLRFTGRKFVPIDGGPREIRGLEKLPDGAVLVLGEGEVFRYTQGAVRLQRMPFSATEPLLDATSGQAHGSFWARTATSVFYAAGNLRHEWDSGRDFASARVTSLLVDQEGRAWIGTNRGLYVLSGPDEARPTEVPALRGESVSAVFQDREGNVWIGTESSGLHVLRPRAFRNNAAASGEAVTAVVSDSSNVVWFGTRGDGLHTLAADGLQTPIAASSLTSPYILSLARGPHGDIWAGTPDGLNRIVGHRVETYTAASGLPDDFVRSVAIDSNGTVWAGTRRGLARFDGKSWTTLTTADGLGSDSIGPLLESSAKALSEHELWIGTSAGLSRLRNGHIENFAPHPQAGPPIVTALSRDGSGGLWVGLHGAGLWHFRQGTFQPISSTALPSEIVAILQDGNGDLWLRGGKGVYRVAERELLQCIQARGACDARTLVYGTVDGLPNDALAVEGTSVAWHDDRGQLWFATKAGLAVTNPKEIIFNALPPPVVVEGMQVDDANVPIQSGELRIRPGHNRYVFDFAAMSFTAPSKNRYRYMLENFDRDWIEAGAGRSASYTNLPARPFVFRVQAANNDGVWNREGAAVRFRVLPPFYRRWWFYLVAAVALSGVAFGIYQLRVLSLQRRFHLVLDERNRVAREVHDTLAQDFVSVSLQLDLATAFLKGKQLDAAQKQLQETRKLVKDGLEEARQSIWNLRANTAADSLPARLTELVKRYAQAGFRVRLKMGGAYHSVPASIEREVLRIAQESLSNVERHALATEAAVELQYEQTALRLSVKDNGRGFSLDEARALQGHYGLRGMQERAEAVGGEFTIQSEPGEGTRVTLLVSLPERGGART